MRLSSEVGNLSLKQIDPCTEGGQFSSVEDVLLGPGIGLEADSNSSPTLTSGEAVLVSEAGRAKGLLHCRVGGAEG